MLSAKPAVEGFGQFIDVDRSSEMSQLDCDLIEIILHTRHERHYTKRHESVPCVLCLIFAGIGSNVCAMSTDRT